MDDNFIFQAHIALKITGLDEVRPQSLFMFAAVGQCFKCSLWYWLGVHKKFLKMFAPQQKTN